MKYMVGLILLLLIGCSSSGPSNVAFFSVERKDDGVGLFGSIVEMRWAVNNVENCTITKNNNELLFSGSCSKEWFNHTDRNPAVYKLCAGGNDCVSKEVEGRN